MLDAMLALLWVDALLTGGPHCRRQATVRTPDMPVPPACISPDYNRPDSARKCAHLQI